MNLHATQKTTAHASGEMLLKEFLDPLGVSQKDFAKHPGWTYARLNEIINSRRGADYVHF